MISFKLFQKPFILFFFSSISFYSLANDSSKNQDYFNVSLIVPEVSGAVYDSYQNVIWSIGDSGKRIMGRTELSSKKTESVPIIGHPIATDREELVSDAKGNIWILSVGDNDSVRNDIEINMIDPTEFIHTNKLTVKRTIKLSYPDGPKDVEAAYYFEEKIYLIEKTFSSKAKIYSVDISQTAPMKQVAKYMTYIDSLKTRLITAACMDEKEDIYLLTYYGTFKLKNWKISTPIKTQTINVSPFISQMETLVCYKDKLMLATEDGAFWLENK